MDRERLIFRTYMEIPYTVDIVDHPDAKSEDGLLHICFCDDKDIVRMSCYGEEVGIPIDIIENKLTEFGLNFQEYDSAMSYFIDNNSCDNEDYIIIRYDDIYYSTGVKDVFDNTVFEGDLVKVPFDSRYNGEYPIIWKDGAFVLGNILGFEPIGLHKLEIVGTTLKECNEILM